MPNWCTNHLKVTGPAQDVEAFMETVRGSNHRGEPIKLRFASTVPAARVDRAHDPTGFMQVDLQVAAWGTKWDLERDEEIVLAGDPADGEVTYRFDTAWSPPAAWLIATATKFPALAFQVLWCEEDSSAGRFEVAGGELTDDEEVQGSWEELNAWCEANGLPPHYPTDEDLDV